MKKPIQFRGKWFPSMAAAARAFGLKPNSLHRANLSGRAGEVGISRGKATTTSVMIDDVHYNSVKDAAKRLGLHRTTISRMIDSGRTGTVVPKGKPIEIEGVGYASISEASRILGVSRDTVIRRWAKKLSAPKIIKLCCHCQKRPVSRRMLCEHCFIHKPSDLRD